MNTNSPFRLALVATLLLMASFNSQAQLKKEPVVICAGFWVVETPPKGQPCIVRFYTDQQQLIYQETVHRCLKITRRQTKRQLNLALEQALFVWQATHHVLTDRQWVSVQFERH